MSYIQIVLIKWSFKPFLSFLVNGNRNFTFCKRLIISNILIVLIYRRIKPLVSYLINSCRNFAFDFSIHNLLFTIFQIVLIYWSIKPLLNFLGWWCRNETSIKHQLISFLLLALTECDLNKLSHLIFIQIPLLIIIILLKQLIKVLLREAVFPIILNDNL